MARDLDFERREMEFVTEVSPMDLIYVLEKLEPRELGQFIDELASRVPGLPQEIIKLALRYAKGDDDDEV